MDEWEIIWYNMVILKPWILGPFLGVNASSCSNMLKE